MGRMRIKIFSVIIFVFAFSMYPLMVVEAEGHNHVTGVLRVDLPEIYNAQKYQVIIMATEKPNNGYPDYTDGWIGLELDNSCPTDPNEPVPEGCAEFIQVGILTKSDGARWFVFAEPGVTCLRGETAWGTNGCQGNISDIITIGTWYKVELQKHETNWTALFMIHIIMTIQLPQSTQVINESIKPT